MIWTKYPDRPRLRRIPRNSYALIDALRLTEDRRLKSKVDIGNLPHAERSTQRTPKKGGNSCTVR